MKTLRCVNGQFRYGDIPVTKPFMRVLVRQINKERAEKQMARQCRAFEMVAQQHLSFGDHCEAKFSSKSLSKYCSSLMSLSKSRM